MMFNLSSILNESRFVAVLHIVLPLASVFLLLLVGLYGLRKFLAHQRQKADKYLESGDRVKHYLRSAVADALDGPAKLLLVILALTTIPELTFPITATKALYISRHLQIAGVVSSVCWFLLKIVKKGEHYFVHFGTNKEIHGRGGIDKATASITTKLLLVSIFTISALVVMQSLGLNIGALLAFTGISGVAIAYSTRDLIASMFTTLAIYMDRPFTIGDVVNIKTDRGETEGIVEKIGWRISKIRNFDTSVTYIVNAVFSLVSVKNLSRAYNSQLTFDLRFTYQNNEKLLSINNLIKETLSFSMLNIEGKEIRIFNPSVTLNDISQSIAGINILVFLPNFFINDINGLLAKNAVLIILNNLMSKQNLWYNITVR